MFTSIGPFSPISEDDWFKNNSFQDFYFYKMFRESRLTPQKFLKVPLLPIPSLQKGSKHYYERETLSIKKKKTKTSFIISCPTHNLSTRFFFCFVFKCLWVRIDKVFKPWKNILFPFKLWNSLHSTRLHSRNIWAPQNESAYNPKTKKLS